MCYQCEILNINSVNCHETGCPDAWKDEIKECKWCPTEFAPESQHQQFCCDDCAESYNS